MSLFTIGDLHLSLGEDKPMDIFSGWKDYVNRIYENWQKQVSQEDTVVIVGDISWAMRLSDAKEDFNFINNLNGTKIILKGNHDYWFDTKTKTDLFLQNNNFNSIKILFNNSYEYENYSICGTRGWINETGEDDVKIINREVGRLKLSLQSATKPPIAFLHYPPVYCNNECSPIMQVLQQYNIKNCYYGHIHGNGHKYSVNGIYKNINFALVASDYVNFTPIKIL